MTTILISILVLTLFFFTTKFLLKKKRPSTIEQNQFDQNPIETTDEFETNDEIENPIKPFPVNCQKAIFRPAPEKFSYFDCCGKLQEGEGYQPWEKRSPVSIDVNKEFLGMDLLGEEAEPNC